MTLAPTSTGCLLDGYDAPDCLIYGIGNVARQDDGLGWAFVDWLEDTGRCSRATRVRGYQLQLEDAELLHRHRRVLFVDATRDTAVASYRLEVPMPRIESTFTSHALSVPTVLATAQACFGQVPETRLLAIRGHEWELATGLTGAASDHLAAAIAALTELSPTATSTEGRSA